MKCVHCGLLNPEGAVRCDCGYDFASRALMDSYLQIGKGETRLSHLARECVICCGIGALIFVVLSLFPAGETMFKSAIFVAAKIFPNVGLHDPAFLLLWVIAFLIML